MTTRQYLMQLKRFDVLIDQKIAELDDLREKVMAIGSFDYSRDKIMTSPDPDAPYVKTVQKIIDLDAKINRVVDNFIDKKHKIVEQIQNMEDTRYVDLLYKRYVEYKSFETVAEEMNYTYQYVISLHGAALQSFETSYGILYMT